MPIFADTQPVMNTPSSSDANDPAFRERRGQTAEAPGVERRQFAASRTSDRPEVNELAEAIDEYKLANRRRFITVEELLDVMTALGYSR